MRIKCPHCGAQETIASGPIPAQGLKTACGRCKREFRIRPSRKAPRSAAPATPTASPAPVDLTKIYEAFPTLRDVPSRLFDLPSILKPDAETGSYQNADNAYRVRLMRAMESTAQKLLEKGERVVGIGMGAACYSDGLPRKTRSRSMLYSRCAILSTTRRLMFFNIDTASAKKAAAPETSGTGRRLLVDKLVYCRHRGTARFLSLLERWTAQRLQKCIDDVRAITQTRMNPEVS